jgi:hypothetical protein
MPVDTSKTKLSPSSPKEKVIKTDAAMKILKKELKF